MALVRVGDPSDDDVKIIDTWYYMDNTQEPGKSLEYPPICLRPVPAPIGKKCLVTGWSLRKCILID